MKNVLENYRRPDHFGCFLGYRVLGAKAGSGVARCALTVRRGHLSPAGRVHGGVIASFLDASFGVAMFTMLGPKDFCSTVEIKVNYLRPVRQGDELRSRAQVVFRGKRLAVLQAFLTRAGRAGDPIAMATATFNIVTPKAPAA